MVVLIIDHTELSWCHPVDFLFRVNHKRMVIAPLKGRLMVFRGMTNLKRYLTRGQTLCEEMEIVHLEILLISRFRVVAMRHVEDILSDILLDDEPRATAKAHALSLTNRMEPQALMLANHLTCFELNHIAWLLAKVATDIVVVVNLAQEADALRILSLGVD